jgi:hypothetical protein
MKYISTDFQKQLLKELRISQSANDLVNVLDALSTATYKPSANIESFIESTKSYSPELAKLLTESSVEIKREIIKEVRKFLIDADKIKIEISYTPSKDFLYGLYDVFQNLGYSNFLFEITTDPEIGTGAKFYYKGNFIDISMLNFIREKMKGLDLNK